MRVSISRRRWLLLGVAIVTGVMLVPIIASAVTQSFADVPPSHPFFVEIESIKKAGVTQGSSECAPPISPAYCPNSLVRRDAMAAFMERGFTRVEGDTGSGVADDYSNTLIASAAVSAGAAGAGTQGYVIATITGNVIAEANCPCVVGAGIGDSGSVWGARYVLVSPGNPETFSYQAVIPVSGDSTHTFDLVGTVSDLAVGTEEAQIFGEVTAIYVPFDGDANNTFGGASAAPASSFQAYTEGDPTGALKRLIEVHDRLMAP